MLFHRKITDAPLPVLALLLLRLSVHFHLHVVLAAGQNQEGADVAVGVKLNLEDRRGAVGQGRGVPVLAFGEHDVVRSNGKIGELDARGADVVILIFDRELSPGSRWSGRAPESGNS